ncbi:NAD(P)H-dependent oxidoreductase [Paenibacillus sabinae]|uniref:NAD(P)H dehydrogenase n=1 Tax=Paenibacillus sabinae T27 TaxID=1268072 RepID=X4ZVR3_9BACL|nr:NAD(P)H-dependent oxidoreductase [Paenibacillus sabinae]AHV96348.1 NAD(P)H dehydrogenase [Paenibacillus sabinae T27]
MNVLIIYAHPNPASFNHATLEKVKQGLKEKGHAFTVIDLYQEQFNPVLKFGETSKRRDLKNDPETERYRNLVKQADHFIFVYPVWWYGTPAILKGFFDRVFVSGFAYIYEGLMPKGLLAGKSAWVIYTIDSPSWFVRLLRGSTEWKVIKTSILKFCGIRSVKRMMFAGMKGSSIQRREKWLQNVYRQARQL